MVAGSPRAARHGEVETEEGTIGTEPSAKSPKVSRRRNILRFWLVMLLILGAAVALGYWDKHRYDAKVPLGTWYGTFTAPKGLRGALLVVVKRRKLNKYAVGETYNGSSNGVNFRGSAELCFTAQGRQYFRLNGLTDQTGPGFTFELASVRGPAAGLRFSDGLHGARHQGTLSMSGHLIHFTPQGDVLSAADLARETPVRLVKGDRRRYAHVCRALKARR